MIDVYDVDHSTIEWLSALMADIQDMIGVTEHEDYHTFCFESEESQKLGLSTIKSFSSDIKTIQRTQDQENWNQIWEDNFSPVVVEDYCAVIAPHHDQLDNVEHCIVINPEMSFGTGHHETTFMMIEFIKSLSLKNKRVLDFGCGTGLLAILAYKQQAQLVDAVDYDQLCIDSTNENKRINHALPINVIKGDASILANKYDVILANVNRNALIQSYKKIYDSTLKNGLVLLSGLLIEDFETINSIYRAGFQLIKRKERGQWISLLYERTQ